MCQNKRQKQERSGLFFVFFCCVKENLYRERMRSARCSERERIENRSVQSACLPIFPHNHPTSSCLSLSLSLILSRYRSLVSHVALCSAVPPLHLPVSLSFSVVSHGDTNPRKIPNSYRTIRGMKEGWNPLFQTRQKSKNDLIYWANVRPRAQTAALGLFFSFLS